MTRNLCGFLSMISPGLSFALAPLNLRREGIAVCRHQTRALIFHGDPFKGISLGVYVAAKKQTTYGVIDTHDYLRRYV